MNEIEETNEFNEGLYQNVRITKTHKEYVISLSPNRILLEEPMVLMFMFKLMGERHILTQKHRYSKKFKKHLQTLLYGNQNPNNECFYNQKPWTNIENIPNEMFTFIVKNFTNFDLMREMKKLEILDMIFQRPISDTDMFDINILGVLTIPKCFAFSIIHADDLVKERLFALLQPTKKELMIIKYFVETIDAWENLLNETKQDIQSFIEIYLDVLFTPEVRPLILTLSQLHYKPNDELTKISRIIVGRLLDYSEDRDDKEHDLIEVD